MAKTGSKTSWVGTAFPAPAPAPVNVESPPGAASVEKCGVEDVSEVNSVVPLLLLSSVTGSEKFVDGGEFSLAIGAAVALISTFGVAAEKPMDVVESEAGGMAPVGCGEEKALNLGVENDSGDFSVGECLTDSGSLFGPGFPNGFWAMWRCL